MEDKLYIVEPLIDKREEQEQLVLKLEKELEQRREVLDMLKKEEQLIRAKDEAGFNELRSELPEDAIYDEFFARNERWPNKPEKQVEKIVEKEVRQEVNLDVDLDDEVPWKDCVKGGAAWFLVFGGIIILSGVQTLVFEIIEGGVRSVFAWVMMIFGLIIAGVGVFIAWNNRRLILQFRSGSNTVSVTEETTELVDNEDYPLQLEDYKRQVVEILKTNLAKQNEIKDEANLRKISGEIKDAKGTIFRIDKVLYPAILTARYVVENGVSMPKYYTSADLKKLVKVVKSGKVDNLKKACEYYEKYVTMSSGKVHE